MEKGTHLEIKLIKNLRFFFFFGAENKKKETLTEKEKVLFSFGSNKFVKVKVSQNIGHILMKRYSD